MTIAKPLAGTSNGELVRRTFEILNQLDSGPLRAMWTDATVERFPAGTVHGADGMDHFVIRDGTIATTCVVFDQMQFARQIGMLPADGSPDDRATKAALNAKTRLLGRLRARRRR